MHFIKKNHNFMEPSRFGPKQIRNMNDNTFSELAQFNSLAEAEVAKTQLQDAEIWVDIRNEFMSTLNSIGGAATLVVRTEDLEQARRVLELE